ncbi:MAG: AraC family transcriptional regulator [Lachnospiraceae bacterium]|nr:AraC family transcriptional regulator [Lachnospiraceae bacterium]
MSTRKYFFSDKIVEHMDFKLLYVNHMKYEGKWEYQSHSHNFTQIFYFLNGKGSFTLDGTPYPIKSGDIVIVNPHIIHKKHSDSRYRLEYIVFAVEDLSFKFGSGLMNRDFAIYGSDKESKNYLALLTMMINEAEKAQGNYELICKDMAEIFIANLARSKNLGILFTDDPMMSKECSIAKSYIDTHYMDNLTLEQLSEITHVSKYYLIHSFDKYMGDSPMNYLQQKRIQVAERLLATTGYSVSTIASNVGFSSQSYFAQVFKKYYGTTPAQYRKDLVAKPL